MLLEGLVDRAPDSGRWLLGPELYFLGGAARLRYDVTDAARPVVQRLAVATGESAFFSARRGDETICLVAEDGSFPVRSHVLAEGTRFPLGVASAGLAILAHLPDEDIANYLARVDLGVEFGDLYGADQIWGRVRSTREVGYAINPGLVVDGDWGMGAAVFDGGGLPQWALSLTGIEQRFAPHRRRELGEMLLRAALGLSKILQGRQ